MIVVVYTFLIIFAGLIINNTKPRQVNLYIIFCAVILVLISGLRSIWVGTDDTYLYSINFKEIIHHSYEYIWNEQTKDPFYYVFNKFVAGFTNYDFQNFLIVVAIIYVGATCYVIKKESSDPLVSFIVLLAMGFFFFSMNGIRQSLAISFTTLAYIPLKHRKILPFILLVVIGSLFHKTALVFLIAYPLCVLRLNKFTIFIYIIILLFCLTNGHNILDSITEQAQQYDERIQSYRFVNNGLTYSGLFQLLIFALFAFKYFKAATTADKHSVNLYVLLIIAVLFQSMAVIIAEMFRISMYFSVFLILLTPKVFEVIPTNYRKSLKLLVCGLLLLYFFLWGSGNIEYRFYFQDIAH